MTCLSDPCVSIASIASIAEGYRSGFTLDVSTPNLQRAHLTLLVISRREYLQVLIVCPDIRRLGSSHLHRLRSIHLLLKTLPVPCVCHPLDSAGAGVVYR